MSIPGIVTLTVPNHSETLETAPCPYQILYPAILMMKATEDRSRGDLPKPLNWPMAGRILGEGEVCSRVIIIGGIGSKDPAQVGLADYDDVIEALPTDRADQL